MNVGIYACPGCMKAAGIEAEDLIQALKWLKKISFSTSPTAGF
jgi:hypothetical protein